MADTDLGIRVNTDPVSYGCHAVFPPGGVHVAQLGQPAFCWLSTLSIQSILPHILPAHMHRWTYAQMDRSKDPQADVQLQQTAQGMSVEASSCAPARMLSSKAKQSAACISHDGATVIQLCINCPAIFWHTCHDT